MAPAKRRSTPEYDDDPSDEGIADMDTGHRRKRARLSHANDYRSSVVSDLPDGMRGQTEPVDGDDDVDDGLGSDIDINDEDLDDDEEMRKDTLRRLEEIKENYPADEGVIEEVYCENFMCHEILRITLGPLINFIIGHNGSGKSAVLTALTLCLGTKATATNRGANIKAFIKEGKDTCLLKVKIKNQGEMAFKPEEFGQSIIVERHFSRTGGNGYKIKSETGRIISTKKQDLEAITDFFAMQMDNPINVLSQDNARQFLSSSTPQDKYKFFIKGTQLQQLDNDYTLVEEGIDSIEAKLESRLTDVSVLEQRYRDAEAKKKLIDETARFADKIRDLQRQHAWSQVEEQEGTLAQLEQEVERAQESIDRQTSEYEAAALTYENDHGTREAAQDVINNFKEELEPKKQERDEIKAQFDENRTQLFAIRGEQRRIQDDHKAARDEKAKFEKLIQNERKRIEDANGPAHARKLERVEELRAQIEEINNEQQQHAGRLQQLRNEQKTADEAIPDAQRAKEERRAALLQAQSLLQGLQRDQGQFQKAYHPKVETLLRAIQNEARFKAKPVGPVGYHVRLLKPEWQSIIERTLGNVAEAFIVTNKSDQALLSELIKKCGCPDFTIYIGNPRPIDVSQHEPTDEIDTMLRVMEIGNDLVRNQLIINQRIEQTVLIKNRNQAVEFFRGRHPNVAVVICMSDEHRDKDNGTRYNHTRSGAESSNPVHAWQKAFRLKTDAEAQMRIQRERVNDANRTCQEAENRARELETAQRRAAMAVKKHGDEQRDYRAKLQQTQTQMESLQDEIEEANQDTGALDTYYEQLEEAKKKIEVQSQSYQDSVDQIDQYNENSAAIKRQLDAAQAEIDELTAKITKTEKKMQQIEQKRDMALRKKNSAYEKLEDAKRDKQEAENSCVEQRNHVEAFVRDASEVCLRVPVEPGMTPAKLDERLERMQKDKARAEERAGGNREQITLTWERAKRALRQAREGVRGLESISTKMKRTLNNRQQRWHIFRKLISSKARIMFTYMLSERGFRGNILFDHQNRALDIDVEPDISRIKDKGRQAKTLSGGEKSFSTICLLLAIWEAMGSPIRCLDEFDVFMDNVNRDISMKMMIQAAGRSVGRQFILITPQAMGSAVFGDEVRIHKMSDPERGQTALPFGR